MSRWLVDGALVGAEFRAGVAIHCEGSRIVALEAAAPPGTGRLALPGFVNAHVHLDLSSLRGEDLEASSFAAWAEGLVARRRALSPEAMERAVQVGLEELLAGGTVAVGDIDSAGRSLPMLRRSPMDGVVYREVIGRPGEAFWARVRAELPPAGRLREGLRVGLSPHAPYSTPEDTLRRCLTLAADLEVPLACHLDETQEERQFLQHGRGPLADLFTRWGLDPPQWSPPGCGSLEHVLSLPAVGPQFLAIHGNYASQAACAELSRRRVPLVYCPRSHAYFGHPAPHPATVGLAAGAVVALGTDSRASNAGLDMWQEMACWRRRDPQVADRDIFAAATEAGRAALGLKPAALRVGDEATFQIVAGLPNQPRSAGEVLAQAVRARLQTRATVIRGVVVHGEVS